MRQILIDAIHSRKVLLLFYIGIPRTVEPHAFGISREGNDVLSCYQIGGQNIRPGHEWDLLTISKITHLTPTGEVFAGARPLYKPGDKRMITIYAEL
jgi:hypothetical protein